MVAPPKMTKEADQPKWLLYVRGLVFLGLIIGVIQFHRLYGDILTFQWLKAQKASVDIYIDQNPILGAICYTLAMTGVIGFNVPGATFLSLCGGLFFQQPFAMLYAYTGYVLGATISYTLVRFIFADSVKKYLVNSSDKFKQFSDSITNAENFWDVVSVLIFVRYVAFAPFWFVNASCAVMDIGYGYFVSTTAAATVPGSLIYTLTGRLLSDALSTVDDSTDSGSFIRGLLWRMIFKDRNGQIVTGLLIFCSLLPVFVQLKSQYAKKKDAKSMGKKFSNSSIQKSSEIKSPKRKTTTPTMGRNKPAMKAKSPVARSKSPRGASAMKKRK